MLCFSGGRAAAYGPGLTAALLIAGQAWAQGADWTLPASGADPLSWEEPSDDRPPPPRTARNALYFELLGSAGIWSVNYARMVDDSVDVRVGFGAFEFCLFSCTTFALMPLTTSYLLGSGSSTFELGGGLVGEVSSDDGSNGTVLGNLLMGYRYQPRAGGTVFRLTFTPLFRFDDGGGALPWLGTSVGGAF